LIAPDLGRYSGKEGAPMLSKYGVETIHAFVCFADKPELENPGFDHDFGDFDINKVP
jgi:hypothetical protein